MSIGEKGFKLIAVLRDGKRIFFTEFKDFAILEIL